MADGLSHMAVVYCRVSSRKQETDGNGLSSQERTSREFAGQLRLRVEAVFADIDSGATLERSGMNKMLEFLRRHRREYPIVIVDDLNRLARDVSVHLELRRRIKRAGAVIATPSMKLDDDDPDSEFMEGIQALSAQLQRKKNALQTRARMRGRMLNGYWVFQAPIGYRYAKAENGGHVLVRDEPTASLIQTILEGFASGRLQTQAEVLRYFLESPDCPSRSRYHITSQRVHDILTRVLYAGYIDVPRWNISFVPAKHEPLIPYDTFQAIQHRLQTGAKVAARPGLAAEFPLRGFISCDDCGAGFTAAFSRGNGGSYGYYRCSNPSCVSRSKSIRREKLESDFEDLLSRLQPRPEMVPLFEAALRRKWEALATNSKEERIRATAELAKIDRSVDRLMDRIVATDSDLVVDAYEKQVRSLEEQRATLRSKIEKCGRPVQDFDATYRTGLEFLASPLNLWASDRFEDKRMVLKLAFSDRIAYSRQDGFRTVATSSPFSFFF